MSDAISSIISSAEYWEQVGYWASSAVVFGIIFEAIDLCYHVANGTWRQKIFDILGFGLVTVGLFTELLSSFEANSQNELITATQRKEIIALEKRLAARSLEGQDAVELTRALNRYVDQEFEIHGYPDDQESINILDEIAGTLRSAGWVQKSQPGEFAIADVVAGVRIYIGGDATDRTREAAEALVAALSSKSIDAKLRPSATLAPNRINVMVGIKP